MKPNMQFNKDVPIVIYGAASTGIALYHCLSNNGFTVLCFLDRRADEIGSIDEVPVYNVDGLPRQEFLQALVVLAIKNVFEHEEIVKVLSSVGWNYFVYKPYSIVSGGDATSEEMALSDLWDQLTIGRVNVDGPLVIPHVKINNREQSRAPLAIRDGCVVFSVPVELIFTGLGNNENPWVDINVLELYPHIELFRYLFGDHSCSPQAYIDFCSDAATISGVKVTEFWRKSVFQNRSMVFHEMQRNLGTNYNFFINSAPKVQWNPKGYFNLHSGKHRVSFLVAAGFREIPVLISRYDFDCWQKFGNLPLVVDNCEESNLSLRISHPRFLNQIRYSDMCFANIHVAVMREYRKFFGKRKTICFYDWRDDFLLLEILYHKGADIVITVENEPDDSDRIGLMSVLSKIYGYKFTGIPYSNAQHIDVDVFFGYGSMTNIEATCYFLLENSSHGSIEGYQVRNLYGYFHNGEQMFLNVYIRCDVEWAPK